MDPSADVVAIYARNTAPFIALIVVLIFLSTTAVALRLFSRKLSKTAIWYDDCLIIVALVMSKSVMVFVASNSTTGSQLWILCLLFAWYEEVLGSGKRLILCYLTVFSPEIWSWKT